MGVQNLTDEELGEFLSNPKEFLASKSNQIKVLGLDDPAVAARIKAAGVTGVEAGLITQGIAAVVTDIPTIGGLII
ncbi:hypothetical protein [Rhizobium sp. CNPSo 3490]|uniref:hypothetical protein n=1 Tax=Rhizobium sp. CNPSo 3490 TaxID=3021407 RepID=UPI00254A454B|nr:hypothetical protein [Rhizobium sp. CNPSo 3490]MDK4733530.1 hypothetical protein [Rhizobium sp. CNPSo 3490]